VDNIVEMVHAERGILLMKQTQTAGPGPGAQPVPGGDLYVRVARDGARKDLAEIVGMSRSIPQQVFETRKAMYLLDSEQEKDNVQSQSVSIYHLRTVMCAPLRVGDKLLGVLYVDSHAKTREYSATDLALFEAATNYLALTVENIGAAQEQRRRDEEKRRLLEQENALLRGALEKRKHVIGSCAPMKAVYETVRKVAPTDATVLILGESGTGKEVMAHVVHDLSPRGAQPFVIIDCAAIPETLLESELFGYEKGAFTGAAAQKAGKFELAHGGTLFLDEIAELPLSLQVKLLRALEQRTVTRVGGTEPIRIDARLVTATNRNLDELVAQGKFRQDLYFRLKVVTVTLPPLRERGDDILLLAEFILTEANTSNGRQVKGLSEEARRAIMMHRWDGNIRELKHRIEQAVILTNNEWISTEDLNLSSATGVFRSLETARDIFEKGYIVKALAKNQHNVTHTAKSLGISRQHLQNLIKKHGITKYTDTGE
jgi:transcriptional regulator with GAF, ATPase, and Fis domain